MEKRWEKSGDPCRKCQQITELLVDDKYCYAERCTGCGWRINFGEVSE